MSGQDSSGNQLDPGDQWNYCQCGKWVIKKNYLTSQRGKRMVILTFRDIHELERSRGVWEKAVGESGWQESQLLALHRDTDL